jgi:hypothetical protein
MNENKIEWSPLKAIDCVENFDGFNYSGDEIIQAWAYLIKTKLCWQLQGWYGRQAYDLINNNVISLEGEIL